jgi:hypothetical protein
MDPPRNLRILSEQLGKAQSQIRSYSAKHKWAARVRAYDSWLAEQMAETDVEEKRRLRREHLRARKRGDSAGNTCEPWRKPDGLPRIA